MIPQQNKVKGEPEFSMKTHNIGPRQVLMYIQMNLGLVPGILNPTSNLKVGLSYQRLKITAFFTHQNQNNSNVSFRDETMTHVSSCEAGTEVFAYLRLFFYIRQHFLCSTASKLALVCKKSHDYEAVTALVAWVTSTTKYSQNGCITCGFLEDYQLYIVQRNQLWYKHN